MSSTTLSFLWYTTLNNKGWEKSSEFIPHVEIHLKAKVFTAPLLHNNKIKLNFESLLHAAAAAAAAALAL